MIFVVLLKDADASNTCRVTSDQEDDVLHITILHKSDAYSCEVNLGDVAEFATNFEIDCEEYFRQLKNYLRSTSAEITADVKNNQFSLYKNITITFFRTQVKKTNYTTVVEALLDKLCTSRTELQEKLDTALQENTDLLYKNNLYERTLKENELSHAQHEKKLYSCFQQLLNEKKKRIQHLTEVLENRETRSDDGEDVPVSLKKRKRNNEPDKDSSKKEYVSDSDEEKISYESDDSITLDSPNASTSKQDIIKVEVYLPPRSARQEVSGVMYSQKSDTMKEEETIVAVESVASPEEKKSPVAVFSTQDIIDRM